MAVVHVLFNVFLKIHVSRVVTHPELLGVSIQTVLIKFVSMQPTVKENQLWKQTALVHVRSNAFQIRVSRMAIPQVHQCVEIRTAQHKNVSIKGQFSNYGYFGPLISSSEVTILKIFEILLKAIAWANQHWIMDHAQFSVFLKTLAIRKVILFNNLGV